MTKLNPYQALRAAADFASRDSARKNVHQVLFTWTGEQLHLRSTDGHAMCSISLPSAHEPESCALDLSEVNRLLKDLKAAGAKNFEVRRCPAGIFVGEELYMRSFAASPPHCLVLTRTELGFAEIKTNRKALADAVEAVKPAARKDSMQHIELTLITYASAGEISSELRIGERAVPCAAEVSTFTSISWALLARALKWAPRGELRLAIELPTRINGSNHRVFVESENYTAVLIGSRP